MSSRHKNIPTRSRSSWLRGVKRLVVKVGTSTLTSGTHNLDETRIEQLAVQIADLRSRGVEVILVTSGAIGVGMGRLRLRQRPSDIGSLQAVAAVGQNLLMHTYDATFRRFGHTVGQLLITASDLADRKRYVNFGNALMSLFRYGVIPIVNENDTVAVDEIRVGDNDTLSAHVANAAEANLLILLSDTDGMYTADPREFPDAERIPVVTTVTPDMLDRAEGSGSRLGTGGMTTKLRAAAIVTASGVPMVLALGSRDNALVDILDGFDVGTLFVPSDARLCRRKRWIGYTLTPRGTLTVDAGAREAVVERGKSLLPSGIAAVAGDFAFGDAVRCVGEDGTEFARGLVNYPSDEIVQICGKHTNAIEMILGYRYADEVIHRSNLVVLENSVRAEKGGDAS